MMAAQVEQIAELVLKVILAVASLGALTVIGAALAKASGWASRVETTMQAMAGRVRDGFEDNKADHELLKDLMDEHTRALASHTETLIEHRIRIRGLEHHVFPARMRDVVHDKPDE